MDELHEMYKGRVVAKASGLPNHIEKVKYIYGLFNDAQKPGIKLGLVPFGIERKMAILGVSKTDIDKYDTQINSKREL